MGFREMWKMVHLLHLYGKPGLTRTEVFDAGIDCNTDTIQPLLQSGAVEEKQPGEYFLSPAAHKLLEVCIVANRTTYGSNVRVDFPSVFVIMPFSEEWSQSVYTNMIEPAAKLAQMNCVRGDTTVRVGNLTSNIWEEIMQAGIVVADISASNVNVFYELGLTHALGKDTLLLKRKDAALPADFGGAHYNEYSKDDLAHGCEMVRNELTKWAAKNNVFAVKALHRP